MKNRVGRFSMGQGGNKLVVGLIVVLIVFIVLFVVVLFIINSDSQNDQEYIVNIVELWVFLQVIVKNVIEVVGGIVEVFNQFWCLWDEFQMFWNNVFQGNLEIGLLFSELVNQSGVKDNWNIVCENVDSILFIQDVVLGLYEVVCILNEIILQLQVEYDDIVQILFDNDVFVEQIVLVQC